MDRLWRGIVLFSIISGVAFGVVSRSWLAGGFVTVVSAAILLLPQVGSAGRRRLRLDRESGSRGELQRMVTENPKSSNRHEGRPIPERPTGTTRGARVWEVAKWVRSRYFDHHHS
jgi:hypothetical protein